MRKQQFYVSGKRPMDDTHKWISNWCGDIHLAKITSKCQCLGFLWPFNIELEKTAVGNNDEISGRRFVPGSFYTQCKISYNKNKTMYFYPGITISVLSVIAESLFAVALTLYCISSAYRQSTYALRDEKLFPWLYKLCFFKKNLHQHVGIRSFIAATSDS